MKVLAEWFRPREFSTMTDILMAMGGLGSLVSAAPLAALSAWVGWRMSFVAVGVATLALAALVWAVVRGRPSDLGLPSPSDAGAARPEAIPLARGVGIVVRHLPFWALAVWFFFECAVFFSFGGLWGGRYLMQVHGYSKAEAGGILSMLAVGMMVGSPVLSIASNRWFRGRKPVIVLCSAVSFGLAAALAFATEGLGTAALHAVCFGLGAFTSAVVGRDVESMIRDITELAVNMVKAEESHKVQQRAEEMAEEKL